MDTRQTEVVVFISYLTGKIEHSGETNEVHSLTQHSLDGKVAFATSLKHASMATRTPYRCAGARSLTVTLKRGVA